MSKVTAVTGPALCTLGELRLGRFRKVKSLLLLVYAALEGPTPRRQLAALLWPNAAKPEASLRVALHALRESAPDALGGDERLAAGVTVTCDAAALLALRGEAAWEAYPGPFLHGVTLPDVSAEFEEWVDTQRERLARHVQGEALRAAEDADPARAAVWAERAYRLPGAPPLDPAALRRLLPLTLPGSALEAEVRAELAELTGPDTATPRDRAVGRMLGREAELDALLAWAHGPDGGLAVVTGPGGIGKSTLTRELLRELTRLDRPVTLVDAEGTTGAPDLAVRLAAVLTPGQAVPDGFAFLSAAVPPGAVLLLDGLDAAQDPPALLGALRRDLPAARWLVSTRHTRPGTLRAGDLLLPLGGLNQPAPEADLTQIAASSAAQLFVREAARVRRNFTLHAGNAALIAGITRRLLGHPLALALAASWLRVEPLDAAYARVLTEAGALTSADAAGDGRRGLAVVARRSWDLLGPAEQHAALRLSITADFDPADAPALGVTVDELDALLTHSFVEAHQPGSERLRLYPALAGLLAEQAGQHPALMHDARATHARHYLTWLTTHPPEAPQVTAERENILTAVRAALAQGTLDAATVDHLLAHHDRRGLHQSGTDTFAELADAAEDAQAPADVQAAIQVACMWLAFRAGRLLDAQTLAGQFLAGSLAADPASRMKVLNTLAAVRGVQGQIRSARELLEQALTLAITTGDATRALSYRMNLLTHLTFLGDEPAIHAQLAQVEGQLAHLPAVLSWHIRYLALSVRTHLSTADEQLEALLAEAQAVLQAGLALNVPQLEDEGHQLRTRLALRAGRWRQSEDWLAAWRAFRQAQPGLAEQLTPVLLLSQLHYARGRTPQARRAAAEAAQLMQTRGNPWEVVEVFLITARDLHQQTPGAVLGWLSSVARAGNVHSDQRRRSAGLLQDLTGEGPDPAAPAGGLSVAALSAWVTQNLAGF